jgi:predicted O-methyltransferase YrrM
VSKELWTAVEQYVADIVAPSDAVLDAATAAGVRAGLPTIAVTPNEGKFLQMLARLVGAKRILEVGTLAGYSTIWMARALPADGNLVTLELDSKHADVARSNFARAKLDKVIDVRVGPALETLPKLEREKAGPFDLVFIDADKQNNADYFTWAITLSRPGAVIVVDNVIRDGAVVDANSKDPSILGVRRLNELLRSEKRVTATTLQTVGSKGYDGFTLAIVNRES